MSKIKEKIICKKCDKSKSLIKFPLECQHRYCSRCLSKNWEEQISLENINLLCLSSKCINIPKNAVIKHILSDEIYEKLKNLKNKLKENHEEELKEKEKKDKHSSNRKKINEKEKKKESESDYEDHQKIIRQKKDIKNSKEKRKNEEENKKIKEKEQNNEKADCEECIKGKKILVLSCGHSLCYQCLSRKIKRRIKREETTIRCSFDNKEIPIEMNMLENSGIRRKYKENFMEIIGRHKKSKEKPQNIVTQNFKTSTINQTIVLEVKKNDNQKIKNNKNDRNLETPKITLKKKEIEKFDSMSENSNFMENLSLGISDSNSEKSKENLKNDETLKNKKSVNKNNSENQLIECPTCQKIIEKRKGINLVICDSQKCAKKTKFCYFCKSFLTSSEEVYHFSNKNLFSKCKEFNKIHKKNEEENKQNDLEIKGYPCTQCENSQMIRLEFSDKLITCVNCGKIFCIFCEKEILKLYLADHIDKNCPNEKQSTCNIYHFEIN